jgi:hypothetical protein
VGTIVAAMLVGALAGGVTLEALLRIGARGWSAAAFGPWEERRPWEAIRQPGPDGEPRPVPGGHASWRLQPWARPIEYRLDRHGFRAARGPTSAAAPCRVLAIGDSHTFGYGVGAEQAWPAMLESMLARANVANAGICGSGVAAEQAWLPDALAASHAQVVVIAVTPWSLRDDPEPPEQHELDARWPRAEAYFRKLTRYSAVADRMSRVLFQRTSALIGWPPPAPVLWELTPLVEPPASFHARWAGVHARLARMVELVRQRGATPLVLFVPLDVQVSEARNALYRDGRLPYRTHGFVDRDYTQDTRYLRALDKTATKLHVTFLDATPMLRALAPAGFLTDSYHLAVEGHAHLAALLASPVAEACAASPALVEAASPLVTRPLRDDATPLRPAPVPPGAAPAPSPPPPPPRTPHAA